MLLLLFSPPYVVGLCILFAGTWYSNEMSMENRNLVETGYSVKVSAKRVQAAGYIDCGKKRGGVEI